MRRTDLGQLTWSEAQGSRTEQYQNNDLLQHMTILCATVQSLGKQMQDGFAAEGLRRQEDYWNVRKTMTAKMEEGFRIEQQARQLAQSEMTKGLKDEENVNRTPHTSPFFSCFRACLMMSHTTLAQVFVRVVPSMCHAPGCVFDLSSTLSSHS